MSSFLRMPADWVQHEDRWEELTTRGGIWTELRRLAASKSAGQADIDQLRADLEQWRKANGDYATEHEFDFIEKILDLTQLILGGKAIRSVLPALEPWERDIYFALIGKPVNGESRLNSTISVLFEKGGSGILARLEVEILKDGTGCLYPDPIGNGFIEFYPDFMNAARNAWSKVIRDVTDRVKERESLRGVDVRFRLKQILIPELDNPPLKAISGKSPQLAFYLCLFQSALACLERPEGIIVDQSVAASATIENGEGLGRVAGLAGKLEAAYLKGLDAVVVSKDAETEALSALKAAKTRNARDDLGSAPEIIGAGSSAEAVDILRDRAREREAYRKYLQKTTSKLDILGLYQDVPREEHYMALPLLLHVPEKDLPHNGNGFGEGAKSYTDLREADIRRWEERVQKTGASFLPVPLDELFTGFRKILNESGKKAEDTIPRFILLGPPGSGKSTFAQYLSWRAANGNLTACGRKILPALVRLKEWQASKYHSLPDYLEEKYRNIPPPAPTALEWRQWLQRGAVLLLFDGLDEIDHNESFRNAFKESLVNFNNCPSVITCRSVSFEQHKALCSDFPVFTLGSVERTERNNYIQKFPAQNREYFDPEGLIKELDRTSQMQPLAENPLLLSIICYVFDGNEKIKLPTSRGILFDKVVEKLLDRKKGEMPTRPSRFQMRRILESAALDLFAGMANRRQLIFDEESVIDALTRGAEACGLGNPGDIADNLLKRAKDTGLLREDYGQGYLFLHLTVQEFLAACALARQINDPGKGRHPEIELESRALSLNKFLDSKAWDPRWQEVITLMAGRLKDPSHLLKLLSDAERDDLYRHRLGLSILCLGELKAEARDSCSDLVDSLTSRAFKFWWENSESYEPAGKIPEDFARILPALGQLNRKIGSESLLEWLLNRFTTSLTRASSALGSIGSAAATPLVLDSLADMILGTDPKMQERAAHALGRIANPSIARPILDKLADMLYEKDPEVRGRAANSIGRMGSAAATPLIRERLSDMLHGKDPWVQMIAAHALGKISSSTALPSILGWLSDERQEEKPWAQVILADSLCGNGNWAANRSILEKLSRMLDENNPTMQERAVLALGSIGSSAATHPILDRFADLLEDPKMRGIAAFALGRMGSAAALHPKIPERLSAMLLEKDPGLRKRAAYTLGRMGSAAVNDSILERLSGMLLEKDPQVRSAAVDALGRMGSSAALHSIPDRLTGMLEGKIPSPSVDRLLDAIEAISNKEVRAFRGTGGKVILRGVDELAEYHAGPLAPLA